jgi:protein tyrosine/serine phosphatase
VTCLRWTLGIAVGLLVTATPIVYYRMVYSHAKRLRVVEPGVLYRSGSLTADGLADAVRRYGIRTVINLQDEYPDPDLPKNYFDRSAVNERELCESLGVRYVWLPPDLISRRKVPAERPQAIDRFLSIMDDPANHPVLMHCRAGLHRTGVMSAVYRMEYQKWTPAEAVRDVKKNGFGDTACTCANDYVTQYVLTYRRGVRHP